ncbi:DUF2244 domain-containing protein [Eleftheria terrae]|uniref:DUF2244 domain-containing protein n=1 Tax=Eleftheria terrae TaxID=1597781 RepID=UPI00263AF00E|nr:DUF2244 domain-containing protein [Eleftheria terrae]WKB52062.1 DUF2244 domain-containing protein [Eleftheria terrae]
MATAASPVPLPGPARLGSVVRQDDAWEVEWVLKRNCSMSPRQLLAVFGSLCAVSLGIASFFWAQGAGWVMPFAWAEVIALGVALRVYARHAGDRERIALKAGCLRIEREDGRRTECFEFIPAWVRIEPRQHTGDLIAVWGRGQRIEIGRHLRPDQRSRLAEELRSALRGEPALQWQGATAGTSLIESLKLK